MNRDRDRGGGQVVSVFAFSDDPSSNPFEAYNFFCNNVFEKIENKQKGGRGWATFLKKMMNRQVVHGGHSK